MNQKSKSKKLNPKRYSKKDSVVLLIMQAKEATRSAMNMLLPDSSIDAILSSLREDRITASKRGETIGERLQKHGFAYVKEKYSHIYTPLKLSAIYRSPAQNDKQMRIRYQRQSEILAIMMRNEIETIPYQKPDLYSEEPLKGRHPERAYYQSVEMKDMEEKQIQVRNSRAMGLMTNGENVYSIYNFGMKLPKWEEVSESRMKEIIGRELKAKSFIPVAFGAPELFAEVLKSNGGDKGNGATYFRIPQKEETFYFYPYDEIGNQLFYIYCVLEKGDEITQNLISALNLQKCKNSIPCDGEKEDGTPVLLALDNNVSKMQHFHNALMARKIKGAVYVLNTTPKDVVKYLSECAEVRSFKAEALFQKYIPMKAENEE